MLGAKNPTTNLPRTERSSELENSSLNLILDLTAPARVSPEVTAAVQYVIRRAGFHAGMMPLVDMRNGGHGYVVDACQGRTYLRPSYGKRRRPVS